MRLLATAIYDAPRDGAWMGDSCFLYIRRIVYESLDRGHFVTWVLPDIYDVPSHPRLKLLRFTFPEGVQRSNLHQHYLNMKVIATEFVGAHGDKFIDAVICNDAWHALLIRDYFGARRFLIPPAVVHWHGYPTIIDWKETDWVQNGDDNPLFIRAMGYALTDFVSCCPYCSGRIFELVRTYCPPKAVERFLATRSEVMLGPDTALVDSLPEGKNETFSMYWGGRFTATKGGERSVERYLELIMGGRDAEAYVTVVGGGQRLEPVIKKWGAKQALNVMRDVPYEQAMAIAKRSHAAIFYQLDPGAAAPYEWMYAGVITLFKRYGFPEEPQMYPPGYPFLFKDDAEAATMLRWIYDSYDEAWGRFQEVGTQAWVKAHTDKRRGCQRIIALAEERAAKRSLPGPMTDTRELVAQTLGVLEPPVTLPMLLQGMERVTGRKIVAATIGRRGLIPYLVHMALPEGWVDDCTMDVPRYVPEGWSPPEGSEQPAEEAAPAVS